MRFYLRRGFYMMKLRHKLAFVGALTFIMSSPLTALAATPGDNLTPQFQITDETTAAAVQNTADGSNATNSGAASQQSAQLAQQPDNTSAQQPAQPPVQNPALPAQTTSGLASSNGQLPKVELTTDAIRPYMTVPASHSMSPDPVLDLVPLASYFLYNEGNTMVDFGYTSVNDSFAFSPNGFNRLMLEQGGVGRWYYRTYAGGKWGPWGSSKDQTPNQGLVQAVQIRTKGYTHKLGDLYTRAVLNDGTLTDWAPEGMSVGTMGDDRYIVALKLALVPKGSQFFGSTEKPMAGASNDGVVKTAEGVIYQSGDGTPYTGTAFDSDSNQYYFENGVAVKGWHEVDGFNVYFDENGIASKDLTNVMGLQSSYAIRVNKATRSLYVLAKDSSGHYTIPFKTMMVTVGTDTPLGNFSISEQLRWHFMHTDCYTQYLSRFYGHFLFHSLLYSKPDNHTLDAIYYNYMDDSISGGCVRLRAADCAWIYNNCKKGTQVTIYSDPWDKGPVEKDAIDQAIPRDQNYDPTDPLIVAGNATAEQQAAAAAQAAKNEAAKGKSED